MAALDTVWASLEQRAAEEQGGSFVQEVDTSSAAQEDGDSDEPSTAVLLVMQVRCVSPPAHGTSSCSSGSLST
jgi:hypothetical protein